MQEFDVDHALVDHLGVDEFALDARLLDDDALDDGGLGNLRRHRLALEEALFQVLSIDVASCEGLFATGHFEGFGRLRTVVDYHLIALVESAEELVPLDRLVGSHRLGLREDAVTIRFVLVASGRRSVFVRPAADRLSVCRQSTLPGLICGFVHNTFEMYGRT
ncbi:hypothetical protein ACFQMM_10760 [Saliphagus sp. GCM10025308]